MAPHRCLCCPPACVRGSGRAGRAAAEGGERASFLSAAREPLSIASRPTPPSTQKTLPTSLPSRYNTPKYRLVVRFTTRDVVCQIVHATLAGDIVMASAYAHELPRYGLSIGLTNYAATYCTGLLVARRALAKLGLADAYAGLEEASGEDFTVEPAEGAPRPFAVLLDTGLKRTSTGSRVFAALKGALDGGLDIPHSDKRFVGYDPTDKALDTETLEKYILGGHIGEYMEELKEEDPEKYQTQFASFVKAGVDSDDLEDLYRKVHAAIRADPSPSPKPRTKPADAKRWKAPKSTYEERKQRLKAKLAEIAA